jgi:hypothetical protein
LKRRRDERRKRKGVFGDEREIKGEVIFTIKSFPEKILKLYNSGNSHEKRNDERGLLYILRTKDNCFDAVPDVQYNQSLFLQLGHLIKYHLKVEPC